MQIKTIRAALAATAVTGAVAVALAPAPAAAQVVADQTLSSVEATQVGQCTTLAITFNVRVQIRSYFPTGAGRELHIRIRPFNLDTLRDVREALRPPASVPTLTAISFEGDDAGGPTLSLLFSEDTRFEVEGGPSPDTVIVRLYRPGASGDCTAPIPSQQSSAAAAQSPPDAAPAGPDALPGLYVVNAISSPGPLGELSALQKRAVAGKVVYDSAVERSGIEWHRLRVGFFQTKAEADAFAHEIEGYFPAAWALGVTADERVQALATRLDTSPAPGPLGAGAAGPAAPPPAIVATAEEAAEVDRLIAEAETAIQAGEHDRAIQLLTNARALPEAANSARAIELLGLTRERKGQTAQAIGEYEDYLARYGQAEGAERVRQRLAALTAPSGGPQPLREASGGATTRSWTWAQRGSFSQFYFRDQSRTTSVDASLPDPDPDINERVNLNQLLSAADVTISGGNDRTQLQLRAAGSYSVNFQPGEDDLKAITALYLDYSDSEIGLQTRFGRQTRNSGGVFGRFDGTWVAYQASEKLRVNAVLGFPVLSSRQTHILDDRWFYGASVDFGAKRDSLQATIYALEQRARGGFIDRRSIGFEARYLLGRFNAFALLDYDIHFSEVNLALATLNYSFPDTSSVSVTVDYRKSPLLTANNALINQISSITLLPLDELGDLLDFYTEEQIYALANSRTQTVKTLTATYARPITDKLQANFDLTVTSTNGLPLVPPTSGTLELPALPGTGTQYYWGAQLIGTGLIWENDTYILSGRYSDAGSASSWTADFNARVPLSDKFRLSPRLRYGERSDSATSLKVTQFQPSVRMNYYPFRHGEIELEAGYNIATFRENTPLSNRRDRETGLVLTAGYRIDF